MNIEKLDFSINLDGWVTQWWCCRKGQNLELLGTFLKGVFTAWIWFCRNQIGAFVWIFVDSHHLPILSANPFPLKAWVFKFLHSFFLKECLEVVVDTEDNADFSRFQRYICSNIHKRTIILVLDSSSNAIIVFLSMKFFKLPITYLQNLIH